MKKKTRNTYKNMQLQQGAVVRAFNDHGSFLGTRYSLNLPTNITRDLILILILNTFPSLITLKTKK